MKIITGIIIAFGLMVCAGNSEFVKSYNEKAEQEQQVVEEVAPVEEEVEEAPVVEEVIVEEDPLKDLTTLQKIYVEGKSCWDMQEIEDLFGQYNIVPERTDDNVNHDIVYTVKRGNEQVKLINGRKAEYTLTIEETGETLVITDNPVIDADRLDQMTDLH